MGRLLILLVIVLGVALYLPDSRSLIVETTRPLANPAYRWMSNQQMKQIVSDLEHLVATERELPVGTLFPTWLRQRYPQDRSRRDAWGTPYELRLRGEYFEVVSAGPDGVVGTPDDLIRQGSRTPIRSR